MKTANELAVGEFFVGHVWRNEFLAEQDKKRFPGALVMVACVLHGATDCEVKDVLGLFTSLPSGSSLQVSGSSLWVCGVRDRRSDCVRLIEWNSPCPVAKIGGTDEAR